MALVVKSPSDRRERAVIFIVGVAIFALAAVGLRLTNCEESIERRW